MEIRSPLSSVSSLLSSSSVFMLSIHRVSTGPSNRIHFWSGLSSLHTVRMMRASTPSCHSCVPSSKEPYSSLFESARGFMTWTCTCTAARQVQRYSTSAFAELTCTAQPASRSRHHLLKSVCKGHTLVEDSMQRHCLGNVTVLACRSIMASAVRSVHMGHVLSKNSTSALTTAKGSPGLAF